MEVSEKPDGDQSMAYGWTELKEMRPDREPERQASEMVRRLAAVIEDKCGGCDPRDGEAFLEAAEAAIEAMREPTEGMLKIGGNTMVGHSWGDGGEFITDESAGDVFRAMIDEALKP